ncbi:MAG: hypothetical protein LBQ54_15735, partial [Planctomycetaceae bacterium]|nr:hypothetical protein [Planctomycetaceae bacterium]
AGSVARCTAVASWSLRSIRPPVDNLSYCFSLFRLLIPANNRSGLLFGTAVPIAIQRATLAGYWT